MYAARANGRGKQTGNNPIPKFENSVFDMKYKSQGKHEDKVSSPKQKSIKEKRLDRAAQQLKDEYDQMKERRALDQI